MDSNAPPCIILNAPQLAHNIGAVARVMANFGLADLRLVNPRDGWPQERAWASASGAEWPLNAARVYESVAEAIADLHLVYATTARPRELQLPVIGPRQAAADLAAEVAQGRAAGLLFGGERAGLETNPVKGVDRPSSISLPAAVMARRWETRCLATPDEKPNSWDMG